MLLEKLKNPTYSTKEKYYDRDYLAGAYIDTIPDAPRTFWQDQIQYNQKEVNNWSCTIHGACAAITNLTGRVFTVSDREMILSEMRANNKFEERVGAYVSDGVYFTWKFHNATRGNYPELKYMRADVNSYEFWSMIKKGYTAVTGTMGNSDFSSDFSDSVIDNWRSYMAAKFNWGHCWVINPPIYIESKEKRDIKWKSYYVKWSTKNFSESEYEVYIPDFVVVQDSYYKYRKNNIYRLPWHALLEMVDERMWFQSAYFFTIK